MWNQRLGGEQGKKQWYHSKRIQVTTTTTTTITLMGMVWYYGGRYGTLIDNNNVDGWYGTYP